jgi:hypothetical protein
MGNSEEYNLAPETMAGLPVPGSDATTGGLPIRPGTESDHIRSSDIRDGSGALKRQAARFRIYQYPAGGTESYPSGGGTEIRIGGSVDGKVVKDILWTVHVANKKANTFELAEDPAAPQGLASFQGGRLPGIRNASTLEPEAKLRATEERIARLEDPSLFQSTTPTPLAALQIAALESAARSAALTGQPPIEQRIAILNDPARIKALTIDPGPRAISGRSAPSVRFDRATEASYFDAAARLAQLPGYPKTFPGDHFHELVAAGGAIDTLGEIQTDEHGRLIFVGGYGRAAGWKIGGVEPPLEEAVNNDQWFDDASDGPVSAILVFEDGSTADTHGAWVTATDPSTAPQILNAVSLWDDIYDIWVRQMGLAPQIYDQARGEFQVTYQPTFDDQIFPIFRSAVLQQWVTNMNPHARAAHRSVDAIRATDLPSSTPLAGLTALFRNPNKDQFENTKLMPLALGDGTESMLALRMTQYFFLERWNSGLDGFHPGSGPQLGDGERLDKATLVACLGGRFSPGIDLTFIVRDTQIYVDRWQTSGSGPFRIHGKPMKYAQARLDRPFLSGGYVPAHNGSAGLEPGDVSKFMAIPWHTDYNSCATHPPSPNPAGNRTLFWSWPAQRPVAVFAADDVTKADPSPIDGFAKVTPELGNQRWSVRGPGTDSSLPENWGRYQTPIFQFVENWHKVGVVLQSTAIDANPGSFDDTWYLETQSLLADTDRTPVVPFPNFQSTDDSTGVADERVLFYKLMNIESHPDVVTEARAFADYWLAWAEKASNDPKETPSDQLFFPYSEQAFQARIDAIYQDFVDDAAQSDPALDPLIKNRADMITRIIQFAPFNLTDGCWLRNVGQTGPIDEVRSLLFSVFMDEMGDGDISKNHCNIYQDLCHSVGYYPAALDSSAFASDPQMLQSAFTLPAFQLAISQFSETYYPEILGMTLNLEWSVVDLKPTRDLAEYFGIDPHFYVMHIGIDNAVNGHGQRASAAIQLYLQNVRSLGGESEVARMWRRIWNGYFAFGNVGTLGQDLQDLIEKRPTLRDQMIAMIERKKKYGQSNHQTRMIGDTRINEWFNDPPGFLDALATHGWIVPGDWDNSRMKRLTSFETGPMFRVFTDDELALWENYTNSLGTTPPKPVPQPSSVVAMAGVIDQLRIVQLGNTGHQSAMLADAKGEVHSLAWWFERPAADLMGALSSPLNGIIVPGEPQNSRFLTDLIAPVGIMGSVFGLAAKVSPSESCREVVGRWIADGCPIPVLHTMKLRLNTRAAARVTQPRRKIRGMGAVH